MRRVVVLLAAIVALTAVGRGAPALPAYFALPAGAESFPDSLVDEAYGEADMPLGGEGNNIKRGHHWSFRVKVTGIDPSKDGAQQEALAKMRAALTAGGWVVRKPFDTNPPSITFEYQKGTVDAWLFFWVFGSDDIRGDIVEVKPFTPAFTLAPPAAKPETVGADESFPYLKPIANGKLAATDEDFGDFWITLKGQDQPSLVAPKSIQKRYNGIEGLSNLQFLLEYRSALTRAGWEIVVESQGLNQGDVVIDAHYAKNGRDIWTALHFGGTELAVVVADVTMDLAAALNKACRVPMYGITFEYNKSELRPEAEATLQGVLAALQKDTALTIEVQGHTDSVGGDAYNRTLSQARAEAVRTWLASHGIPAARLSAKGYGLSQPVATNETEEGRAKNRRVVLEKTGCK